MSFEKRLKRVIRILVPACVLISFVTLVIFGLVIMVSDVVTWELQRRTEFCGSLFAVYGFMVILIAYKWATDTDEA